MLTEVAPDVVVEASFVREISKGLKSVTIADAVAARLIYEGAVNGNLGALKEILDRSEGKARQSIEISSESKIESLVEVIKRTKEMAFELNRDYGVPMPSVDEITESIKRLAEANGVSEKDLVSRIELVIDDE